MSNTITRLLSDIASDINTAHDAAISHANQAVQLARRCGELLLEAKSQLGHGKWLPWLNTHCRVSARQASNYMRVALHWDALPHDEDLTIKRAVAYLAKPIPKSAPGADLPADATSLRERINALKEQELRESTAIGGLLNWASKHGKQRVHDLEWMRGLSDREFDSLLESLGPHGVFAINGLTERVTSHYGLSFPLFPDVLILAVAKEYGDQSNRSHCDELAATIQAELDAAGLGHVEMEARRAGIEAHHSALAAEFGCTLDEPNDAFIQAVCDDMLLCGSGGARE